MSARNDVLPKVLSFVEANRKSPVVEGHAFPGGGGRYILEDGSDFKFTLDEMRAMPMPRWLHG
jgi:hypothetical protein